MIDYCDMLRADINDNYYSDEDFEMEWEAGEYVWGSEADEETINDEEIALQVHQELNNVPEQDATLETESEEKAEGIELAQVAVSTKPTRQPSQRKKGARPPPALDTSRAWEKPNVQKAIRNAEKYHPRVDQKGEYAKYDWLDTTTGRHCTLGGIGEQCDLWHEGTVSQFSKYGPGITNYFKFVKWCFWVFISLSIIQAVPIALNTYGEEDITDGTSVDYLFSTTAGNLGDGNRT